MSSKQSAETLALKSFRHVCEELGCAQVGANQAPSNVNNLTAVLFLWTILPGYAAASYMPTIVLERPLFVRWGASPASKAACAALSAHANLGAAKLHALCLQRVL